MQASLRWNDNGGWNGPVAIPITPLPCLYRLLPEIFHKGRVVRENEYNIHFYAIRGRLYKAVVKITQKRHENYLTTFHKARREQVESETRKGMLIRDWPENRNGGRP